MVNTREVAEEYRLSHWAQIMQERQETGLSIRAYCLQIGIAVNTYFYWQRRVRAAACQELMPAAHKQSEEALVPSGWAICKTEEPQPSEKAHGVTVEIGGCRIAVEDGTDPGLLAKVCRVLVSL